MRAILEPTRRTREGRVSAKPVHPTRSSHPSARTLGLLDDLARGLLLVRGALGEFDLGKVAGAQLLGHDPALLGEDRRLVGHEAHAVTTRVM